MLSAEQYDCGVSKEWAEIRMKKREFPRTFLQKTTSHAPLYVKTGWLKQEKPKQFGLVSLFKIHDFLSF